jgi:hypothetical protein
MGCGQDVIILVSWDLECEFISGAVWKERTFGITKMPCEISFCDGKKILVLQHKVRIFTRGLQRNVSGEVRCFYTMDLEILQKGQPLNIQQFTSLHGLVHLDSRNLCTLCRARSNELLPFIPKFVLVRLVRFRKGKATKKTTLCNMPLSKS